MREVLRHVSALLVPVLFGTATVSCDVPEPEDPDFIEEEASALHDRWQPPPAHPIDRARELVITDPSVVGSVEETSFDPRHASGFSRKGAWSFGRLVHNMLPRWYRGSPVAASRFVLRWLRTWEADQLQNSAVDPARARPSVRLLITTPWKTASRCPDPSSPASDDRCMLDMTKAPFTLMAIVNRPDLRIVADNGADHDADIGGEGRFLFQVVGPTLGVDAVTGAVKVMDATVKPQKFTVIIEYSLPVRHQRDVLGWAQRWHALGAIPFGPRYNEALRRLTNGFSGPDRDHRRPNGSALDQLRTNEVALLGARFPGTGFVAARQIWELREFHLTERGLAPHTVNLEPGRAFDIAKPGQIGAEGTRSAELAAFLIANSAAVLTSKHKLPAGMSGNSALVGSAPYGAWGKLVNPNPPTIPNQGVAHDLPGVPIPVRDSFALNTCAGCHRHETDTRHFMHISVLNAIEPVALSDERTRIGVLPGTPETAVVISNFLRAETSPGGSRFDDFAALLATAPERVRNRPGMRVCAH